MYAARHPSKSSYISRKFNSILFLKAFQIVRIQGYSRSEKSLMLAGYEWYVPWEPFLVVTDIHEG